MSEIFDLVKVLREKTGAGFVDCKIALEKNSNDIDNAIIYLRKKGTLKVVKKSIRETKEGVVCINISKNFSSILEINTETDFVAKNRLVDCRYTNGPPFVRPPKSAQDIVCFQSAGTPRRPILSQKIAS